MRPISPMAPKRRVAALQALGRHREALDGCDRVLAVTPDDLETNFNRGFLLAGQDKLEEAMESYEKGARIRPHACAQHARHLPIGHRRLGSGRRDRRRSARRSCRGKISDSLLTLAYGFDAAAQLNAAKSYVSNSAPALPKPFVHSNAMRADKLRVAYVTTAFREHPIATAIANLFERHDRERFEIIGVSIGKDDRSGIRARMVGALDQFHQVASESDRNVAKLLNDLQVHIAIDLNGGTYGCGIFAYRPAPIQVSYLGYAGTTGAEFIDDILADEMVPPFDRQPFFTEKIVHLPDRYHVNDATRRISAEVPARSDLGSPDQGVVFCCFSHSGQSPRRSSISGCGFWRARRAASCGSPRSTHMRKPTSGARPRRAASTRAADHCTVGRTVSRTTSRAIALRTCFSTPFPTTRTRWRAMPCSPYCRWSPARAPPLPAGSGRACSTPRACRNW